MEERINELVRQAHRALSRQGIDAQKVKPEEGIKVLEETTDLEPPRDRDEYAAFNKAWRESQGRITDFTEKALQSKDRKDSEKKVDTTADAEPMERVRLLQERVDALERRATRLEGMAS